MRGWHCVPSTSTRDKLLSDPEADDQSRAMQARWILKNVTRAEIAKVVEPAVRRALSAWQSLGPARLSEARPYSTANMAPQIMNMMEAPEATRLQETSARLDQIVRQRTPPRRDAPGPREAPRPRTPR